MSEREWCVVSIVQHLTRSPGREARQRVVFFFKLLLWSGGIVPSSLARPGRDGKQLRQRLVGLFRRGFEVLSFFIDMAAWMMQYIHHVHTDTEHTDVYAK